MFGLEHTRTTCSRRATHRTPGRSNRFSDWPQTKMLWQHTVTSSKQPPDAQEADSHSSDSSVFNFPCVLVCVYSTAPFVWSNHWSKISKSLNFDGDDTIQSSLSANRSDNICQMRACVLTVGIASAPPPSTNTFLFYWFRSSDSRADSTHRFNSRKLCFGNKKIYVSPRHA